VGLLVLMYFFLFFCIVCRCLLVAGRALFLCFLSRKQNECDELENGDENKFAIIGVGRRWHAHDVHGEIIRLFVVTDESV
jgi:hypothetical protein